MGVIQNTRHDRSYRLSMLEDKNKEHDGLYRCCIRQNKMRNMTDRIGVVYAQRQNEIT